MDDRSFLRILNRALAAEEDPLPPPPSDPGDTQAIARWSALLARCVRQGAGLGDPRWERTVLRGAGVRPQRFELAAAEPDGRDRGDDGLRVGLTLLLGMMTGGPDSGGSS